MYDKPAAWVPIWPTRCPKPGSRRWPNGTIEWLAEAVPTTAWRAKHMAGYPWLYACICATVVRQQIEDLRVEYRLTVNQWGRLLPARTVKRLVADTIAEGERLTLLLEQIRTVEAALATGRGMTPPTAAVEAEDTKQ